MRWALLCSAVALVVLSYRDLGNVLSIWFSGRNTSGTDLWGLPMVWWGRIGKLMQFIAGCVVILDLIGPERLRAVGERARNELRDIPTRAQEQDMLLDLELQIQRRIVRHRTEYPKASLHVVVLEPSSGYRVSKLVHECHDPMPAQPWFTASMVDQLRTRIFSGFRPEYPWQHQIEFIEAEVSAFVRNGLPPRQRTLYEEALKRESVRDWKFFSLSLWIPFLVVVCMSFGIDKLTNLSDGIGITISLVSIIVVFLCWIAAQLKLVRTTPAGRHWRRQTLIKGITRFAAAVLDRSSPGHQLRWLGFFLFMFGFLFDLLAS